MITSVNNGRIVNVTAIIGSNNVSVGDNIIPSKSDLAFRTTRRNGLTLTDGFGNNATILPKLFINDSGAKIYGSRTNSYERCLDGGSYTYYLKFKQVYDANVVSVDDVVTFGGGYIAAWRGVQLRIKINKLEVYIADGSTALDHTLVDAANTNLKGQGVFDVIVNVDYPNRKLIAGVYDSDNNLVGSAADIDISSLVFNNDMNAKAIEFESEICILDNFKKFDAVKTLTQCQTDSYRNDLQIHLANLYSSADISGNSRDFAHSGFTATDIYYDNLSSWGLDYGFDRAEKYGFDTIRDIARDSDGNPYYPSLDAGALWIASKTTKEQNKDDYFHNLLDCKIRFTHSFFDRSNTTIWGASARSGYYDSGNKKDFHISELNQRTLQKWLNDGYKGRLFVHISNNSIETRDRYLLKEIFLYENDKTSTDHLTVLNYTGDSMAAILSGGEVTYDGDYVAIGYLKTTKPMFTIRIDDGYDNAYDDWRSVFNGLNIDPSMNIHSELVGTTESPYTFMTWTQIKTLISEGWEITSSGEYDNDWSALMLFTTLESELLGSKQTINSQGIICNHLIPNKHGIDNPSVSYLAHKNGYKTSHAGPNLYNSTGANPLIIDKFNLNAMPCDLAGDYNLDQTPNATEIQNCKDQIDLCVSGNRWGIFYLHAYGTRLRDAIIEVINYAIAQGVENVTMDEALENTKYL